MEAVWIRFGWGVDEAWMERAISAYPSPKCARSRNEAGDEADDECERHTHPPRGATCMKTTSKTTPMTITMASCCIITVDEKSSPALMIVVLTQPCADDSGSHANLR